MLEITLHIIYQKFLESILTEQDFVRIPSFSGRASYRNNIQISTPDHIIVFLRLAAAKKIELMTLWQKQFGPSIEQGFSKCHGHGWIEPICHSLKVSRNPPLFLFRDDLLDVVTGEITMAGLDLLQSWRDIIDYKHTWITIWNCLQVNRSQLTDIIYMIRHRSIRKLS